MSQLTLTPEEDAIVADALRAKAASYLATYGVFDSDLEALIERVFDALGAAISRLAEDRLGVGDALVSAHLVRLFLHFHLGQPGLFGSTISNQWH